MLAHVPSFLGAEVGEGDVTGPTTVGKSVFHLNEGEAFSE